MQEKTQLRKTLTLGKAIALAIGIVLGAGLLILPGIAYAQVGQAAIFAWLIDALIVIPLLIIFSTLGSRYPSAGGITNFVHLGFGNTAGGVSELLLMGAFFLGLPAVAITGGRYLAYIFGTNNNLFIYLIALGFVLIVGGLNFKSTGLSGLVQQILSYSLLVVLFVVAILGLLESSSHRHSIPSLAIWPHAIPVLGIVFFAFTGWEMFSSLGEELHNPKRDFPIAVIVSFLIITFLYIAIALATQWDLSASSSQTTQAPIAAILSNTLGSASAKVIAAVGAIILFANLNSATWAVSRLLFSSARHGLIPASLDKVDAKTQIPQRAVIVTCIIFFLIISLNYLKLISLNLMFSLSGENFFLLYFFTVLAYLKLTAKVINSILGIGTCIISLIFIVSFGSNLIYPLALIVIGIVARARGRKTFSSAKIQD